MTTKQRNSRIRPAVAVILTDSSRRIQWVNEDFTTITGYTLKEVIGKKPSLLQGLKTKETTVQRIRQKLQELEPFKDEILNYRKNGEEYPCRLVIHPIFDSEEELTNFIAFEVDASLIQDDSHISLMQVKEKYLNSSLSDIQAFNIYTKLIAIMETEELYLNPSLKLKELAEKVGTNTRYLSQVINHQTGNNLIHFVNLYRVKEVKKKLIDPDYQNLTAYGISQLCGFKNKSTFYKVFKEIEDMTPNAYMKINNKHSEVE